MYYINSKNLFTLINPYLPPNPLIVEAGAFNGKDTQRLSLQWPKGTIHAFEPVPEIFSLLQHATSNHSNVQCHQYALSDATKNAIFYVSESPKYPGKPFQAGSLLKPKERLQFSPVYYPSTITVPTITLNDWTINNCIKQIDFLWLDVQGYSLNILKHADLILETIKVIYTEVEFVEAYEKQYQYNDIKEWLEQRGFTLFGQDFDENHSWFFGNALFIKI